MQDKKRILFMGTGDIAIPSFEALLSSNYELVALVTQPDKPVGRKMVMTPPQIKEVALSHGIQVLQPEKVRGADELEKIRALAADVIVVMAYGQILPKALLEMPSVACINLHASLLPKFRGASCIQSAIDEGDSETGITVMHVSPRLDEGDIILSSKVAIGSATTGGQLHDELAAVAPGAMLQALQELFDGVASRTAQDDSLASYSPKLLREHGQIDWGSSAEQIERRVRAYDPWPGTYTCFQDAKGRTKRIKIFPGLDVVSGLSGEPGEVLKLDGELIVACGSGSVRIHELQVEGSRRMGVEDFLKASPLSVGDKLFSLA
ncbi:methionyl-tRNA formyltransferase [Rubritalea squalenifaciens DSM 18772]|uniref:Methionyl-tRNA formyltransferase n=1 Tax=Rubritalea squalenifaciens DSM 18772 TaxID=1123071 RepID=A0A1M6IKW2_9BACT|nr:methionyl-tRNA formyltransferase [Rubritalea squalenifaciens]SHJ35023.1 methionyl-tRNA formyltransferase [Rubritalea squalenifaciens DSM 18772]